LRRECERFGGDLWDPADRPEDIATVMVAKLSRNKAIAVACAILKALKQNPHNLLRVASLQRLVEQ
jgi:hypothetical protein